MTGTELARQSEIVRRLESGNRGPAAAELLSATLMNASYAFTANLIVHRRPFMFLRIRQHYHY